MEAVTVRPVEEMPVEEMPFKEPVQPEPEMLKPEMLTRLRVKQTPHSHPHPKVRNQAKPLGKSRLKSLQAKPQSLLLLLLFLPLLKVRLKSLQAKPLEIAFLKDLHGKNALETGMRIGCREKIRRRGRPEERRWMIARVRTLQI